MGKKNVKTKKNKYWMDTYSEWDDGTRLYDWQVADYTRKHMRLIDRLSMRKVAAAMMHSFSILSKSTEEPKLKKNWKYFRDF